LYNNITGSEFRKEMTSRKITDTEEAELEFIRVQKQLTELEDAIPRLEQIRNKLMLKFIELRIRDLESKKEKKNKK
jgi:hypothetical protein